MKTLSIRVVADTAADHCKRLATLNKQSADTLRELAAYHEKRAAGTVATALKEGARFQGGAITRPRRRTGAQRRSTDWARSMR